jgi:hypothetical protein
VIVSKLRDFKGDAPSLLSETPLIVCVIVASDVLSIVSKPRHNCSCRDRVMGRKIIFKSSEDSSNEVLFIRLVLIVLIRCIAKSHDP